MDGKTDEQKSSRELSAKLLSEPGEGAYGAYPKPFFLPMIDMIWHSKFNSADIM